MRKMAALLLFAAAGAGAAAAAEPTKFIVAAGPKGDPALAFAQQLCQLVNQNQKRHAITCEVKESAGAVEGLQALDADEAHMAFARSDLIAQSIAGTGVFRDRGPVRGSGRQRSGGANEDLRALFTLQAETLIVLARADSGIKAIGDVKGKRVNIGPQGSAARLMYELLAPALGWTPREFAVAAELKAQDQGDALCRGRVDAVFYIAANPDAAVRGVFQACDTTLVPVAGREVEAVDRDKPYLVRMLVQGGLYKTVPRDVPTLGFTVVAATSSKLDARVVVEVLRAVFDNLARFHRVDPIYARLEARRMTADGLVAPLHDGAAKLYKERGWIR